MVGGDLGSVTELGGGAGRAEDRDDKSLDPFRVIPANGSPTLAGLGGVTPAEVAFEPRYVSTLGAGGRPVQDTIRSNHRHSDALERDVANRFLHARSGSPQRRAVSDSTARATQTR